MKGRYLNPVQEVADMDNKKKNELKACFQDCEQVYRECLQNGNEEVFCRIQRVPCDSSCSDR